jgi:hypothetical protein
VTHFLVGHQIPPSGGVISRCVEIRIIQLYCTLPNRVPRADPNLRYTKLPVITVGVIAHFGHSLVDSFLVTVDWLQSDTVVLRTAYQAPETLSPNETVKGLL